MILKDAREASALSAQLRNAQASSRHSRWATRIPRSSSIITGSRSTGSIKGSPATIRRLANLGPSGGNQAANVYHNMLVQERNAIVAEQRRLSTLINNLAESTGPIPGTEATVQRRSGPAARVVHAGNQRAPQVGRRDHGRIRGLNGKEEISKALKDLSASSKTKQKLGPSKDLASAIKWLGRLEGSVQSETVALHRENGVDHVDVMLNGKGPFKMVFDTGAGQTTLSADARRAARPQADRPHGPVRGRRRTKVMAKEMIIRTSQCRPVERQERDVRGHAQRQGQRRPLARTELPRTVRLQVHPGIRPARADQGRAGRTRRDSAKGQHAQEEAPRASAALRRS